MSATIPSAPARSRAGRSTSATPASPVQRLGSLPAVAGVLVAVNAHYILRRVRQHDRLRATGLVLVAAIVQVIRGRGADYRGARALSGIGLLMFLLLFMGGFIAIGGEGFQMCESPAWNGLDAAPRNSARAFLTLALVYLPSADRAPGETER